MLLIFPPIAKASEPPAGVARLAGALRARGGKCRVLDGNLEGQLFLMERAGEAGDTWTRRAVKNRDRNLAALRDPATYSSLPRYSRAVADLGRLLAAASAGHGSAGLADYSDARLSPLRSGDLIAAAESPEENLFHPWFDSRLPEVLADSSPAAVGFSLNYLSQAVPTFAMIGWLKRHAPKVRVILGGGLVTSWMSRPGWRNPFEGLIDRMVAGPGEGALAEECGFSREGTDAAYSWDDLPLEKYLSPGFVLPFSASTGCYWNRCSFCPEKAEGNRYSPHPAAQAAAELRHLAPSRGPVLIHLLDNAVSPALLRRLAAEPPGPPWYGFARIEGDLTDPDFCRALKRSGCVMLKLGLESGDQGVLDALEKGIDLQATSRVLSNLKGAGIAVYLYLLFGTPPEGETEARRTLEFAVRHSDSIGFLNLALFNMPVGSREAEFFGGELFYEGDLSLYTSFRHPGGWGRGEVRRFLSEFRRHPAIAPIVRNDPPQFTSNHAAFFTPGFAPYRLGASWDRRSVVW